MSKQVARRLALKVFAVALSACTCNGPALFAQSGELVFVTGSGNDERQAREGQLEVPPVAMNAVGLAEVLVRNVGSGPLQVQHVVAEQGSLVFTLPDLEGLRLAAAEQSLQPVRFAPPQADDPTLAQVEHRARFTLTLKGTRPEAASVPLELVGQALARDCYVPAALDFGEVAVGQRVALHFVLENGRQQPSQVAFAAVAGDDAAFFTFGDAPADLAPGTRTEAPVWFGPQAERAYHALLDVRRSGCTPVTVSLSGQGVTTSLSWAPASLDLGKVPLGLTGPAQVVRVSNRSNATLRVSDVSASPDFVVAAPPTVPPRGTAQVDVACRPTALGRRTATLALTLDTAPPTPVRVPVTCQGGGPRIRVAPTPLTLGLVPLQGAGPSAVRRLAVQNVGTAPNAPGDATNNLVLGIGGRPPIISLVPLSPSVEPGDFEVVVPSNYPAVGVPATAGANGIDLEVRFSPQRPGLKQVELRLYSNDALTPITRVVVSGEARQVAPCSGLRVTAVLPFGDAPRGATVERTIMLQNTGPTEACTVTGFDLTAGSSGVFSMVDAGGTIVIPAGEARGTRVRATVPSGAAEGAVERGHARFFTTDRALPQVTVPIELRVATCLLFSPTALDFGASALGCRSMERALTLYNTCAVALTVDAVAIAPAGAPFVINSGPQVPPTGFELNSGNSVSWGVAFAPRGPVLGTLRADLEATVTQVNETRVVQVPLVGEATASSVVTERWEQGSNQLDILFVVDDSGSMEDEQQALATNFDSFIRHALRTNADFHVGVTTTDVFALNGALRGSPAFLTPQTPLLNAAFSARALAGTSGSGFEQPFEALLRAVTPPASVSTNAGFLRPQAPLAAIIVTDAVEQSPLPVTTYLAALRAVKGNRHDLVNVSVVGPFTPPSATCLLDSDVDQGRYAQVITATGGVKSSICTTDWARDLDVIGSSLLGLKASFPLKATPDPAQGITVTVDGVTRQTGWAFEARTHAIVFASPPAPGAIITATYRTLCL